jgi:hypothetical protein
MADENTPENTTPVPATPAPSEGLFIPRATFGQDEFNEVVDVLRTTGDPVPGFAQMLTNTLSRDARIQDRGPNYLNYDALRTGDAGVLRDLGMPQGRGLTDAQIISLFARDAEGRPIQEGGGFWEGFAREAAPAAGAATGFYGGMQAGNLAVSGVPPVTPWTAAVRVGVPIITGIGGAIFGDFATRTAQEALVGPEPTFVPGTAAAFESGKSTMGALAFLPMPFLISGKVNLGARAVLDNLAADARAPLSTRLVRGVEASMERTGALARGTPIRTGLTELGAVAGTGALAYGSERFAPDSPWTRFGAELIGGVGGGLAVETAVRRVPQALGLAYDGVLGLIRRFKSDNAANATGALSDSQMADAADYLLTQLEANGEDPQAIIDLLNSDEFSRFLVDAEGNPIELSAAELTGSPTLLRLQMESGPQGGTGAGSNQQKAVDALRRGILFMYANGDREALGQLAEVQTSLWDAELSGRLQQATSRLQENMRAVGADANNLEEANRLIDVLNAQRMTMRSQERSLWRQIPQNIEISEFRDASGNVTDTPNFIRTWEELLPSEDMPEARAPYMRIAALRDLDDFVNRKGGELGLPGYGAADGDGAGPVLPEQRRFDAAFLKIDGTTYGERFNTLMESLRADQFDASPEEVVRRLRSEASQNRGRFSTPRTRDYANALDRQAELLIAQQQQPAMDGTPAPAGGLSVTELLAMRNTALNAGRELAASGQSSKAMVAYEFAEAILADLDSFPAGTNQAYDNARAYSRAYNDVWTRAYGGDVLGRRKTGAPAISPETLSMSVFNGDASYLRASELDRISQAQFGQSLTTLLGESDRPAGRALLESANAAGVIDPNTNMINRRVFDDWFDANQAEIDAIPGLRENLTQMITANADIRGPVEMLVRSARAAALDPESNTLNVDALRRWAARPNNARLLDSLPALKADLENIQTARQLLTNTARETSEQATERRRGLLSLYELLPDKTMNPATQVSRAISLTNARPFRELNDLWSYVDNMGDEGFSVTTGPLAGQTFSKQELVNGFRRSIMDSVFNRAGENGPIFDIEAAYRTMFEPHPNSPNDVILADWMVERGIMSEGDVTRTRRLLGRMAQIQAFSARAKPGEIEEFAQQVGPLFMLATRISGSELGALGQRVMGGSQQSLIARQAGSQFAQRVVNQYLSELPASLRMDVMTTIIEDPQLLATVLRRGANEAEQQRIGQALIQGLIDNGIMSSIRRTAPAVQNLNEQEALEIQNYLQGVEQEQQPAPAPAPAPAPVPAPAPTPVVPAPDQQGALVPPAQLPTQGGGAAPNPVQQASAAPPRPPIQSSGPVDRTRFAALFPEDRELLGIGSLMGG